MVERLSEGLQICMVATVCILTRESIAMILRSSCTDYAKFSIVKNSYVLQGYVLATLLNHTVAQCEMACVDHHLCKSINTENRNFPGECQLNSKTNADHRDKVCLEQKSGWTFRSTSYKQKNIGEICLLEDPCNQGFLCTDSCQCPGYVCHECNKDYEGLHCQRKAAWVIGDGVGGEEEGIGRFDNKEICFERCKGRCKNGVMASGATVDVGSEKICYCEYEMTARNTRSAWMSTFID